MNLFEKRIQKCTAGSNKIIPGAIENGKVLCKGNYCKLACDAGFSNYGGFNKAKCVRHKKTGKAFWNRGKLGECRTCGPLEINEEEIKV